MLGGNVDVKVRRVIQYLRLHEHEELKVINICRTVSLLNTLICKIIAEKLILECIYWSTGLGIAQMWRNTTTENNVGVYLLWEKC